LATSGNVSSSAGRTAPPKLAGERPTERSEGFTFGTPVLGGGRLSDAREHGPGGYQGRFLGSVFFGFSRVRKGGCYFSSSTWAKISLNITYKKFFEP
jgi:hypothetical protein